MAYRKARRVPENWKIGQGKLVTTLPESGGWNDSMVHSWKTLIPREDWEKLRLSSRFALLRQEHREILGYSVAYRDQPQNKYGRCDTEERET